MACDKHNTCSPENAAFLLGLQHILHTMSHKNVYFTWNALWAIERKQICGQYYFGAYRFFPLTLIIVISLSVHRFKDDLNKVASATAPTLHYFVVVAVSFHPPPPSLHYVNSVQLVHLLFDEFNTFQLWGVCWLRLVHAAEGKEQNPLTWCNKA